MIAGNMLACYAMRAKRTEGGREGSKDAMAALQRSWRCFSGSTALFSCWLISTIPWRKPLTVTWA